MKKLFLFVFLLISLTANICLADAPEPTKKVVLFYRVSDAILQAQNSDEDIIAGAAELEKELKNHYSKRFIVQEIRRATGEPSLPPAYQSTIKANQVPLIVKIDLEGESTTTQFYQNAFGAKATGVAPAINVHLIEALPSVDGLNFASFDYGIKTYSSGTFAVGMNIYAAQTDPRKNVKNAVRGCFRDACKLNEQVNKYVNPLAYDFEIARYTGNFEKCREIFQKMYGSQLDEIKKFETWCNAEPIRAAYLNGLNALNSIEQKITYINTLKDMGTYK